MAENLYGGAYLSSFVDSILDNLSKILDDGTVLNGNYSAMESLQRLEECLSDVAHVLDDAELKQFTDKRLLLDDDDTVDGDISVIPIVGMGGIGKTTLAQLVYHDDKVKEMFDFRGWVCASEEFDVVKVTKAIIEAITSSSGNLTDLNLLQQDLKEKLSKKKFFVVLDDVWNESYDDWNMLLKPFQKGVKGSKILITTRSKKVASLVETVSPHELRSLSDEDCWLVFSKHARLSTTSMENPTLIKVGKDIIKKCDGLPLAVQALGGLLRGNSDVKYWNHLLKSEIWGLSDSRINVVPALRISYYFLPSYLKRCFVYCSLYPKDYVFSKDELIFSNKNTFVMHDLVHDLAMSFAGEFYVRADVFQNAAEVDTKTRYFSHNARGSNAVAELLGVCDRVKHTRTFLGPPGSPCLPSNIENAPCILLSKLPYLRSLSFKNIHPVSLPDSIGGLIHLRYLDLSDSRIVTLPESLGELYNLQTLKLIGCNHLEMLPVSMKDLVNLRHLDIRRTNLHEMPKGMNKLKKLQFLSDYVIGKHGENKIKELGALADLHESIHISNLENVVDSSQASDARMCDKDGIDSMKLSWSWNRDENMVDSQIEEDILYKLRPHNNLKELEIIGYRGTILPDWLGHSSFHNITDIKLGGMFQDGFKNCRRLPSLGQLPSLKHLTIYNFETLEIVGAEFYQNDESCLETPFPMLETLSFDSMLCWKEWQTMKFNVFPRLRELVIRECPMLRGDLPNHLPSLQSLQTVDCEQLSYCLPRALAMTSLSITGSNKVRIGELPSLLPDVTVTGNHQVEYVLEAITNIQLTCLTSLTISDCSSHMSFPVSSIPASLQQLKILDCRKLQVRMDGQHHSLQQLYINNSCDSDTSFSLLDSFPNLMSVEIWNCEKMECIVVSGSLSCLRSFSIRECGSVKSMSTLWMAAPQLEVLKIKGCREMDLSATGDPHCSLRSLEISYYEKLGNSAAFMNSQFHGLTRLRIDGEDDESGKCLPKEGWLPASLESLELISIESMETLECKGLAHLTSLKELSIYFCPKLENIDGEKLPASLIELAIIQTPLGVRCQMKDPQIWSKISHIKEIGVDRQWFWLSDSQQICTISY
ncbi:hypothetical protein PIB30_063771 [Stylosanthes scabra]|uniref:NB-ARC domain-containing protein n=1 Tax=Stylosanthes scabra TaxID=79078 RepID=A0ABU6WJT8_9FABA|nr:hypothetical protein [Stylosanthes scabra]